MTRIARMLIQEKESVYHVMSRTALPGFPLGDVEKDFLLNFIKDLRKAFRDSVDDYIVKETSQQSN